MTESLSVEVNYIVARERKPTRSALWHITDYVDTCGGQTCIRIRNREHPLKSVSEERDENRRRQVCVHPGDKLGTV